MPADVEKNRPVVFISYSHADASWKDRLITHLGSLERQALLTVCEDGKIAGGDDWQVDITAAMDAASLAHSSPLLNHQQPPRPKHLKRLERKTWQRRRNSTCFLATTAATNQRCAT
jgi:hypothetical protein